MGQAAAVTDVLEHAPAPVRSSSLIVLVAPDAEHRANLLARLDPSTPVLVVPSVEMAQQVMSPSGARDPVGAAETERTAEASLVGQVTVHEDRHAVGFGHVEVSLTPLEFALLRTLIREPGRVWRFDELVRQVWGTDHLGDASQVHAVVKRLRAKLSREGAPVVIEAVRGVGFRALRDPAVESGRRRHVRPARPPGGRPARG